MGSEFRRATPTSKGSMRDEQLRHRQRIENVAHVLYERRELMNDDPHVAHMKEQRADQLPALDWLLAESIVNQGNPNAIEALQQSHEELLRMHEERKNEKPGFI